MISPICRPTICIQPVVSQQTNFVNALKLFTSTFTSRNECTLYTLHPYIHPFIFSPCGRTISELAYQLEQLSLHCRSRWICTFSFLVLSINDNPAMFDKLALSNAFNLLPLTAFKPLDSAPYVVWIMTYLYKTLFAFMLKVLHRITPFTTNNIVHSSYTL